MVTPPYPAMDFPETAAPVFAALRRHAREIIADIRAGHSAHECISRRQRAMAADSATRHLCYLQWTEQGTCAVRFPKMPNHPWSVSHPQLTEKGLLEPIGDDERMPFNAAAIMMAVTIPDLADLKPLEAADTIDKALGLRTEEIEHDHPYPLPSLNEVAEEIDSTARFRMMLDKGWSASLSVLERRVLSNTNINAVLMDSDENIIKALSKMQVTPHDSGFQPGLEPRHYLRSDNVQMQLVGFAAATRVNIEVGIAGEYFGVYNHAVRIETALAETVIAALEGQRVEDIIEHPLFTNSEVIITKAYSAFPGGPVTLETNAAETRREVKLPNNIAYKIWNQNFS